MDEILRWDDTIDVDDEFEFILLDEGDYTFTVKKLERGLSKSNGTDMLTITLEVNSEKGKATVYDYLPLLASSKWKISNFMRSVGLKKHGENVILSSILNAEGKQGRAHIVQSKYTDKQGVERTNNKIGMYYDYVEPVSPEPVQQAAQNLPW